MFSHTLRIAGGCSLALTFVACGGTTTSGEPDSGAADSGPAKECKNHYPSNPSTLADALTDISLSRVDGGIPGRLDMWWVDPDFHEEDGGVILSGVHLDAVAADSGYDFGLDGGASLAARMRCDAFPECLTGVLSTTKSIGALSGSATINFARRAYLSPRLVVSDGGVKDTQAMATLDKVFSAGAGLHEAYVEEFAVNGGRTIRSFFVDVRPAFSGPGDSASAALSSRVETNGFGRLGVQDTVGNVSTSPSFPVCVDWSSGTVVQVTNTPRPNSGASLTFSFQ